MVHHLFIRPLFLEYGRTEEGRDRLFQTIGDRF